MPTSLPDSASSAERPLRVLIVDDAEPVRETIRAMLELYPGLQVVGEAADGEEAIRSAESLRPDVVLMDINLPILDGIRATARIVREMGANVVMISVENGQEYFRRAMKAGARDFLVKPFSADALAEAVRRVGEEVPAAGSAGMRSRAPGDPLGAPGPGRVIAVFGAKGGVGVSTVAANLALALGREAEPAAAVDLELEFGGLDVLLDVTPRLTLADVCRQGATGDPELVRASLSPVRGFPVWLLPAPAMPHLAAVVDGEARAEPERAYVREVLESLRARFAHVVVDAGHGFREAHIQALEAADLVLFVTTPDIPALAAGRKAIATLRDTLGVETERLRVIVNRADEAQGLSMDDVAAGLGARLDFTLPSEKTAVVAANTGQPVAARRARSKLAEGIQGMADRVAPAHSGAVGGTAEAGPPRAASGRFNRFLRRSR